MKYLFIAPIDIYADASAGAETINLYLKELSSMENEICVLANSKGRYESDQIKYIILEKDSEEIEKILKIQKALGWIFYPQNRYPYKTSGRLRKNIVLELQRLKAEGYLPDVVMLETTSSILLYRLVLDVFPNVKLVGSLHDISYQGSRRKMELETNALKYAIRKRYLKNATKVEISALAQMDLIAPHNAGNIGILREHLELKEKKMFPLVPFYSCEYIHEDDKCNKDILFYGLMSRAENYQSAEWFIDHVIPRLPSEYRFIVMGGKPPKHLEEKASEKVIVTGFVDEVEVKNYFEHAFCIVVPLLFGSGIKTKVLTAMASGLPVLTNEIGIEGIGAAPEIDYLHCEEPEEYVTGIEKLANDHTVYKEICSNSRRFMNQNYNMKECAIAYNKVLKQMIEN